MNPTKEQLQEMIAQYEADGDLYQDLAAQNKKIARERVADYRRRVDELPMPSRVQMSNVVRGGDRDGRWSIPYPATFVLLIIALLVAIVIVIKG